MMRIITGRARGVRLDTLQGDATRPTLERTKEAVFSMLQFEMADARVLDLFAGSGQLGLEAISRGAERAVLCDRSKDAVAIIKKNVQKTRFEAYCDVFCMDYEALLHTLKGREPFDIVFLDPPYALGAVPFALRLLIDHGLLKEGAKIICETGAIEDVFGQDTDLKECFEFLKQSRYGAAFVTILRACERKGSEIL